MSRPTQSAPTDTVAQMLPQSMAVLTRPSPSTFELYEKRGGMMQAAIYVLLAALVSGVIAGVFAPLHDYNIFSQFFSRLVAIPVQFAIFVAAVYLIGKHLFKGTGTLSEVAYTFALFFVPLSIVGTLIGIIPILGWIAGLIISVAMVFFGFLAVQSSMNLRDQTQAAITLVLSGVAYWIVGAIVIGILL
ncbi:YIP1 family protein [Deinococcus sp. QL22]|uniref:YIP1 family protein n=1 Tax=Deinococcus sp. QL22 TaxID=2939437 RepID=UPI002016C78D|nr:YIP1 family protein [Deinococcus sp. QL22]UQN05215.1 YIP1 family protein [Deinococcus sp. QL22]